MRHRRLLETRWFACREIITGFPSIRRTYLNSGGRSDEISSFLIGMSLKLKRSLKLVDILLVSGTLRASETSSWSSSCDAELPLELSFNGLLGL